LQKFTQLTAVRLFEEVSAAGYAGGYSQLKAYVRAVRPPPEPVVRFETPALQQAQVAFAEFRLPWGQCRALLVVLGYSRPLWLRFYRQQTIATLIGSLAHFRRRATRAVV
jgi:transposase